MKHRNVAFASTRLALIVTGTALMIALWLGFERTRFGARIRAAVDNRRMAQSMGVDVGRLFTVTFAFGSGLAAVGGRIIRENGDVSGFYHTFVRSAASILSRIISRSRGPRRRIVWFQDSAVKARRYSDLASPVRHLTGQLTSHFGLFYAEACKTFGVKPLWEK